MNISTNGSGKEIGGLASGDTLLSASDKQALGFLKRLDPTTKEFCFRTFDDVRIEKDGKFESRGIPSLASKINRSLKEALPNLRRLNSKGAGVYVVVNAGGQIASDITCIRALFADTDGAPLEPLLVLKPHMVVESSKGNYHVYWLVDNCELDQFTALQTAIARKFGTDPSVKDLPRVMRLPGFNHNKYGAFPSSIITYNRELPAYKVDEVCSGLGILSDDTASLSELHRHSEAGTGKSITLPKLPVERLGGEKTNATFPFTPEGAINFYEAGRVAYQNIQTFEEFKEWGLSCASLVAQKWPKDEVKIVFDRVCNSAIDARTENNEKLWLSFLDSTEQAVKDGKPILTHLSVFKKARENGWKPTPEAQEIPEWLVTMNDEFFVAPYSTTVAVFRKSDDSYIPLKTEAFKLLLANKTVEEASAGGRKNTPITGAWLKHKSRRQYDGVGFWPGVAGPEGRFNHWQRWPVTPINGNVTPALEHIQNIICNEDANLFKYIIGWLAYCVQHPNEPGYVALVIMGGRGTGKTMFAEWVKLMFGRHAMSIATSDLLTGQFTGHLEDKVLMVVEEGFWAGNKAAESAIKHAVTGTTLTIHPKGFTPYDAPNYLHVIMTSNEDWVVPAGVDERRFAVCTVNESRKGDVDYFKALAKWADNGGIAALLDYLLKYDLNGFNVRTPPDTKGLRSQKLMSLEPAARWVMNRLEIGGLVGDEWKEEVPTSIMVSNFCEQQHLNAYERRRAETQLGSTMRKIFPNIKKVRQRAGGTRGYAYRVGVDSLQEARAIFEKYIGMADFDWGVDDVPTDRTY
jgi:hypothetical protein